MAAFHCNTCGGDLVLNDGRWYNCEACEQLKKATPICKDCGVRLEVGENWYKGYANSGRCSCIPCERIRTKVYRDGNPNVRRKHNLMAKYGLTLEQYDWWLNHQNGQCAICKQFPADDKNLMVDHSHSNEQVRGLLCGPCNTLLGMSKDNVSYLASAILYLEGSNNKGN